MATSHLGRPGRSPGRAVSRQWRLLPLCLFLLFPGASIQAQRLLDLGPVIADPVVVDEGVVPYAVQLDIDLIRSAPQRLELPAPDGRLLVAELSVFEDRGGGDAMWAGRLSGSDYESVVFSVVDGYLAGHFGVPGGAKYRISARPDGRGRIEDRTTMVRRPEGEYCGAAPERPSPPAVIEAQRDGAPESVVSASNHNHLDIMILYSEAAGERYVLRDGSVEAPINNSIDYLNLVFRNGQLDVVAQLAHLEQAPASVTISTSGGAVLGRLRRNPEVQELRAEHNADMVHMFVTAEVTSVCGVHYLLTKGDTPRSFSPAAYGLTVMQGCGDETFAHEIGHGLGGNHDPPNVNAGDRNDDGRVDDADFQIHRQEVAVQPYAYGHTWFSGSSPNPPDKDSIMSYGSGEVEPWFSTVRVAPNGWVLGIANERENERALQGTVGIAVRYSDSLQGGTGPDPEPPPPPPPPGTGPTAPGSLTGFATSSTSVRLSWVDRSDDEDGFEVQVRPAGGRWQTAATLPANAVSADVTGLDSGGRYDFRVRSFNSGGRSASNIVTIVLSAAEYTDCVPSAPQIVFEHGFTVSMCIEHEKDGETVQADAVDYQLGSRESGLLYFFDRDNSEVLIKVLDACAVNGYRWVFVAPVTTLAFNLYVDETATGERWPHRNPRGGVTATTKSDIAAFPCGASAASTAVANGGDSVRGVDLVDAGFPTTPVSPTSLARVEPVSRAPVAVTQPISGGEAADCEPQPVLSLRGGYTVNMCVEHLRDGETVVEEVKDYELDSEQSAILYFFQPDNAEVLIKVLDGCRLNGHRWVFVAPVTTLAFNLSIEPPDGGEPWTHENRLNQTAAAKSDITAFACAE